MSEFIEYPKWVYLTDGPQESYEPGMEPVLCEDAKAERKLKKAAKAEVVEVVEPAPSIEG